MKLQIVEPMRGGHHTNYIVALLPSVLKLIECGELTAVTLTVTPSHNAALNERNLLPANIPSFQVDTSLPETPAAPALSDRRSLYKATQAAIDRIGADAVLWTTADYDIVQNAFSQIKRGWPTRRATRAGAIHFGAPASSTRGWRESLKRRIYEAAWRSSDFSTLLMVNPLIYEDLVTRRSPLVARSVLLPDPVPSIVQEKTVARRALGIPEHGQYIAFVGSMDNRKAIPELCDAFADLAVRPDVRLLLAGRLRSDYRLRIEARHAELLSAGRIILIDRHLTDAEIEYGYAASDVNAVLQYPRANLSANVLKAIAANRPAVVDDFGHGGMVVKRFAGGVTCKVDQPVTIARALAEAIELSERYEMSSGARRLVAFHEPENFARVALSAVCGPQRTLSLGSPLTWDWVCASE